MSIIDATINDLEMTGVEYLVTRRIPDTTPDDLDILVSTKDFPKIIASLVNLGYQTSSHDSALGGRIPGSQLNLTKSGRIKIDLHKDFTWRKSRYLDLDLLWKKYPQSDRFLVLINILFEKTYLFLPEYNYLKQFVPNDILISQTLKYGWPKSYKRFAHWLSNTNHLPKPVTFLPFGIVILSYLEKFEIISLMYYLFFRLRYAFNRTLPYN